MVGVHHRPGRRPGRDHIVGQQVGKVDEKKDYICCLLYLLRVLFLTAEEELVVFAVVLTE